MYKESNADDQLFTQSANVYFLNIFNDRYRGQGENS